MFVTDAAQNTDSYKEFANGPFLTAKNMAWFWDAYLPDVKKRQEITASPLRASLDELADLPPAFVLVDENDVLRDEGEAYGHRLIEAGVPTTIVRYDAILRLAPLATTIEGRHPHIDLYGAFGDSVLNVEDRGSIGTAFGPDGAVRRSLANVQQSTENIHITFKEVPGVLAPECPSGAR